jgi:hypothetical protein
MTVTNALGSGSGRGVTTGLVEPIPEATLHRSPFRVRGVDCEAGS